jgi:nucleotide-binding universal stress UspA family protein
MTTDRKILVAIELEGWKPAMEVARRLATALGAEMVLVHVIRPMVNVYPDLPAELFRQAQQEVEKESRAALEPIAATTGARVLAREGEPVAEILAAVAAEAPEMLVIGTHQRRGVARFLLGSVAERVLRQCPVPVVTVAPPEPAPG